MFDFIPNLISAVASTLFPTFATYKALRTSDPSLLIPWLHFFTLTALLSLTESLLSPLLSLVPFYPWLRCLLSLYLVAPGGATHLYTTYVDPFLREHERTIETAIEEGHERARKAGLEGAKRLWEWVRVQVLGQPPTRRPTTPPGGQQRSQASYAQQLLARFSLPSAGAGSPAAGSGPGASAGGGGDFYSMLAGALQQAVSIGGSSAAGSAKDRSGDLADSANLVPPDMTSPEDRMGYITAQRERLRVLLQAFDKEAYNMSSEEVQKGKVHRLANEHGEGMRSRGSEVDFEKVSWDEGPEDVPLPMSLPEKASGGWTGWLWGSSGEKEKGKTE
ncbi:MAG: hypothetical protein Q9165_002996 [Trypethelium subeluteriae]